MRPKLRPDPICNNSIGGPYLSNEALNGENNIKSPYKVEQYVENLCMSKAYNLKNKKKLNIKGGLSTNALEEGNLGAG